MSADKLLPAAAFTLFCLGYLSGPTLAERPVPPLTAPVQDFTGSVSYDQSRELEEQIRRLEAEKGSQVAVLIVDSTQPETIEQYAIRVAEGWKLGRKGLDDGVLLLVAKKDRAVRLEVGYGLEGALNDAVSKRIIEEIIIPRFKEGKFFEGLKEGLKAIIAIINGEPLPKPLITKATGSSRDGAFAMIIIIALAVAFALRPATGRFVGAGAGAFVALAAGAILLSLGAAIFIAIICFLLGLTNPKIQSGFSGGGWSYGSGGSLGGLGGFSGGGGSFGGGGASGRW